MNTPILPGTDDIRDWAHRYELEIQACGSHLADPPPWPSTARPHWAANVEIGPEMGGEVSVIFRSVPADSIALAWLSQMVVVVVSTEHHYPDPDAGLVHIGDYQNVDAGNIDIVYRHDNDNHLTDWRDAEALGLAIHTAALQLRDLEAAQ